MQSCSTHTHSECCSKNYCPTLSLRSCQCCPCSIAASRLNFIGSQNRYKNYQVSIYVVLKGHGWTAGGNLLGYVVLVAACWLSLNFLKVKDFPSLKTTGMPGRETSGILDGILPTATLSNTQTSDMNNRRWKLLKIQRAHASHLRNLGAQLGQQQWCRNWEGEDLVLWVILRTLCKGTLKRKITFNRLHYFNRMHYSSICTSPENCKRLSHF